MWNQLDSILSCTPRTTAGSLPAHWNTFGEPYKVSSMLPIRTFRITLIFTYSTYNQLTVMKEKT